MSEPLNIEFLLTVEGDAMGHTSEGLTVLSQDEAISLWRYSQVNDAFCCRIAGQGIWEKDEQCQRNEFIAVIACTQWCCLPPYMSTSVYTLEDNMGRMTPWDGINAFV